MIELSLMIKTDDYEYETSELYDIILNNTKFNDFTVSQSDPKLQSFMISLNTTDDWVLMKLDNVFKKIFNSYELIGISNIDSEEYNTISNEYCINCSSIVRLDNGNYKCGNNTMQSLNGDELIIFYPHKDRCELINIIK